MTPRWQVKCAIDTVKAALPFQRTLRSLKDHLVGFRREPAKDKNTIEDGLRLLEWLGDVRGLAVLEVGTGWEPMIPILFSLAGAEVFMTDLHPLMRRDTFNAALLSLRENREAIVRRIGVRPELFDSATAVCDDVKGRLQELRLRYLAPCDCRDLKLEDGSMDIVMSRAVLEHIPPVVIKEIFREARRLLRPRARMLHLVDHSDHWAHRDPRISAVNFLQYSDATFRWTCLNPQNYQNRMRRPDYVATLEATGFTLIREEKQVDAASLSSLKALPLDARFQKFTPEELATTTSILLAEASR